MICVRVQLVFRSTSVLQINWLECPWLVLYHEGRDDVRELCVRVMSPKATGLLIV